MAVTVRKIEEMAPDQASLNAASKLLKPAKWPLLAGDAAQSLIWGECQGSGSTPYRVTVALQDLGYKCSCPSRKFPCKHVLALLWTHADGAGRFGVQDVPDWVNDWLGRRRPGSGAAAKAAPQETGPQETAAVSVKAVLDDTPPERDEKAEARAAAQRERQRAARESAILAGLDELDLWLGDQLDRGLAAFLPDAFQRCRQAAQRLVDAKAPGLATWLDALPSRLLAVPEPMRLDLAIEQLGGLHLLAEAYRRQDALPSALRADVRRLVGWTQQRDALVEDTEAIRASGDWSVVATRTEVQPDRLRRVETWLARADAGDGPPFAVLMDFVPVGTGAASAPFSVGERLSAELVFYPSEVPLRALIAERGDQNGATGWAAPATTLAEALARFDHDLSRFPWLDDWPFTAADGVIAQGHDRLLLQAGDGSVAIPISGEDDNLLSLIGMPGVTLFGLWDGRFLSPQSAMTPLGLWQAE